MPTYFRKNADNFGTDNNKFMERATNLILLMKLHKVWTTRKLYLFRKATKYLVVKLVVDWSATACVLM